MEKLDNKIRLTVIGHIVIQAILVMLVVLFVRKNHIKSIELIIMTYLLSINLISVLIFVVLEYKKLPLQLCVINLISSIFVFLNIIFTLEIIGLGIFAIYTTIHINFLTQGIIELRGHRIVLIIGLIIVELLRITKSEYFLLIYQLYFLLVGFYPLLIFTIKIKQILKYMKHILLIVLGIIIFQAAFVFTAFFDVNHRNSSNLDMYLFFCLISTISIVVLYLSNKKVGKVIVSMLRHQTMNYLHFIIMGLVLFLNAFNLPLIIFIVVSLAILEKEIIIYRKNILMVDEDLDSLITSISRENKIYMDMKALHNERVTRFLHDDILQSILIVKRELKDKFKVSENDFINKALSDVISNIRVEMNIYDPKINYKIPLKENYWQLISRLKAKYAKDDVLIDFVCDDIIYLPAPYDVVIYRIINELVSNIYKHSKGHYSEIKLKVVDHIIYLDVYNHGDYFDIQEVSNNYNIGLKLVQLEIDRLNGLLSLNSKFTDLNMTSEDNAITIISVSIPIRREVSYEGFINRGS